MFLDEDIAKLLNENISLQDSNCLAEVLGDYFATSDDGKQIHTPVLFTCQVNEREYRQPMKTNTSTTTYNTITILIYMIIDEVREVEMEEHIEDDNDEEEEDLSNM